MSVYRELLNTECTHCKDGKNHVEQFLKCISCKRKTFPLPATEDGIWNESNLNFYACRGKDH